MIKNKIKISTFFNIFIFIYNKICKNAHLILCHKTADQF